MNKTEDVLENVVRQFPMHHKIYKVVELREMPVGTKFVHSTLGSCQIDEYKNQKYMSFAAEGLIQSGFNQDCYPWDSPMRLSSDNEPIVPPTNKK